MKSLLLMLASMFTLAAHAAPSPTTAVCPDMACFIERESAGDPALRAEWESFFAQTQYRDNIIRIMNRPGTSRPWYAFRANNVAGGQIDEGIAFYQENRALVEKIAQRYGVPGEVLVAVLGIETRYGRNTGSFRVADVLSTLAFAYPKRAEFFQSELREFWHMSRELGRDPFQFTGSYAGAMGMPQFMPSSYRKWAADGDGDGFADIWQSKADALASIAHYLKIHGWQSGGAIRVAVSLNPTPELNALAEQKTAMTRTAGDFRRMGVNVPSSVGAHEAAVLYRLETAPDEYHYALGLNNFYAIWQYNHSRLYVEAVTQIAEGIRAGRLKP
ncbi:MAG: lytic murein transglycosylase B [Neisseria sp.]|nr:lytic murein transglycosylase B [Neisseria sp.]